jgi:NAD(P)-dependent dehydrogenase (short-subunit alcohol dehydrogenase family)
VTGANRGIGRALTEALLAGGVRRQIADMIAAMLAGSAA